MDETETYLSACSARQLSFPFLPFSHVNLRFTKGWDSVVITGRDKTQSSAVCSRERRNLDLFQSQMSQSHTKRRKFESDESKPRKDEDDPVSTLRGQITLQIEILRVRSMSGQGSVRRS